MITSILKYSTMQCVIILCNVLSVTGLFPVFPVFPVVTPGVINVLEHSGGEGLPAYISAYYGHSLSVDDPPTGFYLSRIDSWQSLLIKYLFTCNELLQLLVVARKSSSIIPVLLGFFITGQYKYTSCRANFCKLFGGMIDNFSTSQSDQTPLYNYI